MSAEAGGGPVPSGLGLSDLAIRRPVFITMLSVAIVVLGLLGYSSLATDLYPPVNFPFLMVQTVYPGASPTDMERDVTEPLEDAVGGISGIKKLQSFSRDSVSLLMIQFDLETNLDEATNAVRDRVGAAEKNLPDAADPPLIRQVDIGALPVVVLAPDSERFMDAYGTVKLLALDHGLRDIAIVTNRISDERMGHELFRRFRDVTGRFLDQTMLSYMGGIPRDERVLTAAARKRLAVDQHPGARASQAIGHLARTIDGLDIAARSGGDSFFGMEAVPRAG